jgi:hypothetical protein
MFHKACACGHAVAQVVSHRHPTMAAQVWAWVRSCGISGGQSGAGAAFLCVLQFPLAKHSTDCSTLIIIWGWYKRPVVCLVLLNLKRKEKKACACSAVLVLLWVLFDIAAPKCQFMWNHTKLVKDNIRFCHLKVANIYCRMELIWYGDRLQTRQSRNHS